MDGNKEQAIKAKILAEKKMEKKDFVSALGLAVKAKQLYPDLENISDMILVCDVICSANKKVNGNENDWYSILKLDATADEATIKKQYRKFALTLHPDKNKLTGASDAFSLISQAQNALLDRNTRLVYDKKLQAANVRRGIYQAYKRQPPYQKSCANKFASKFDNQQQQQQQKTQSANDRSTFWTTCPHCSNLFMYYRNIIGKKVACQNCKVNFTTLENKPCPSLPTGVDSPKQTSQNGGTIYTKVELKKDTGINYSRHASELNKHASDKRKSGSQNGLTTVATEASKSKGEYPNAESTIQVSDHLDEPNSEIHKKTVATEASKSKGEHPNVESTIQDSNHDPKKSVATEASKSKGEYPNVESTIQDSNHFNSKIHKKTVATEASKSKGEYHNVESTIQDSDHLGEPNSKIHKKRKMEKSGSDEEKQNSVTRHKFGLSYVENVEDYEAGLCTNTEGNQINIEGRERYLSKDITQCGEKDSELNNFDNLRSKDNFSKGQIWAVYDSLDALPRFYAIVTDVLSPDFMVELTWLEPYPDNEEELKWIEEGFPVSCGKFRCGNSDIIKDIEMFSHLIYGEKSNGEEGTYEVHPRRGETWALFKDWDINWYACSETKKRCSYEFVEVLSDYSSSEGVSVAFLTKLEGLSCIFSREKKGESSVLIPAKEKFRFSHAVPCFKITEKDSNTSFKLDPASLPTSHEDGSVFLKQKVVSSLQNMMEVHVDSVENQNLASCNPTSTQPGIKFYNFYQDKSPNKFQTGQIWAAYHNGATVPIHYGKIKKIDPFPAFAVYVVWLQACSQEGKKSSASKAMGCGSFKVRPGRASRYVNTDLFSHQVKVEGSVKKDVYAIFPKRGEIWALHRDCKNGLCEIVEVVEENDHFLRVSVLERVEGFGSVFRPRMNGGVQIYRSELFRFSHQIPAYQLTEENGGDLHGLWELDAAALQN